ncbi:MAG: hypothetical protein K6U12_03170 [Armatimonadetes bacterium]|nr:hypothetical protein [Armatimonadota bacterium]CUU38073.1 hypothetical protein DCOP10_123134 [Armatimonadetes bacterium DC]
MRPLRWWMLWLALGVAALAVIAWMMHFASQNRIYRYTFPDGSYVRILRLDYAKQSRFVRWRFDKTFPFIHRDMHETPLSFQPRYILWAECAFGDYPPQGWVRDSHGCEYPVTSQPLSLSSFYCEELYNLPTDGQKVTLQLRPSYEQPPGLEYPVQCVKEPVAYPAPERLPITREQGGVRLTLRSIRWKGVLQKWYRQNHKASEEPTLYWQFIVKPDLQVAPKTWKVVGMGVMTLYNRSPDRPANGMEVALLQDCWRQPVYRLYVVVQELTTRRREVFEFLIPPPPAEQIEHPEEHILYYTGSPLIPPRGFVYFP